MIARYFEKVLTAENLNTITLQPIALTIRVKVRGFHSEAAPKPTSRPRIALLLFPRQEEVMRSTRSF